MLHTRYMSAIGCDGSSPENYALNGFNYGMKLVPDAFWVVGLDSLHSFILRLVYLRTLLLDHDWSTGVLQLKTKMLQNTHAPSAVRIFFMHIFTQKNSQIQCTKPNVSTNYTDLCRRNSSQPGSSRVIH